MADSHSITGEESWHLEAYDLPETNLDACHVEKFYDMEDMRNGDWAGSTDTDYETEEHEYLEKTKDHSRSKGLDNPYSKINFVHKIPETKPYPKTSSPRVKNPNEKPKGIRSPLKTKTR